MYTSGWPKNQNKCWYKTGSPPPATSKNEVLIFRSVKSIVMAPARTGRESKRRTAVIITAHTNNEVLNPFKFLDRLLATVPIKFTAPKIDLTPAKCREKMVISTADLECEVYKDRGG